MRPRLGAGLWLTIIVLIAGTLTAGMVITGRALPLPRWAVAQVETRLNRLVAPAYLPAGLALSLGGADLALGRDLVPQVVLRDLRVVEASGQSALALPELRLSLDGGSLLSGELRPRAVRISGARVSMTRDADGRLAIGLAGISAGGQMQSPAEMLEAIDRLFASSALSQLRRVEADALTLTLDDRRAERLWQIGDGRLVIDNRDESVKGELSLTLLDGEMPAQARLVIETSKSDLSAQVQLSVENVAAADLAAQAAPLALLSLVEAPISGRLTGSFDATGALSGLDAELAVSRGRLDLASEGPPVPFEHAALAMGYDPARQRVTLSRLGVESASLRLQATGTVDLLDPKGRTALPGEIPAQAVIQLALSEVMFDPEGLFEVPARFSAGEAALRLRLDPFQADIGRIALREGDQNFVLSGRYAVRADGGWEGAADVTLNRIDADRMIRLWPLAIVPKTRAWLAENLGQGEFTHVTAGLRIDSDGEPRFALDYRFAGAEVRAVRTLPPVEDGRGRAVIEDNTYTVVVEGGHVTAPRGGEVAVGGTVFRVPDITERPTRTETRLISDGPLEAMLSLLDQEPFSFVTKAGRQVDLGEGRALLVWDLSFPLLAHIGPEDLAYDVRGRILDFRSDDLVPGREVASPDLAVTVTPAGMTLAGAGTLDGVPMVGRFDQPFVPDGSGQASVNGTVTLSDENLRRLGVELPRGWLSGTIEAEIALRLARDRPAALSLTSDLRGGTLAIPALSWRKGADMAGRLELEAVLGSEPEITRLTLDAPGLSAEGTITTRADGGLGRAHFSRLRVGNWLDAGVDVTGEGRGAVRVALTGGTLDLRARPDDARGGSGSRGGGVDALAGTVDVALDRVIVTKGIALTGFRGTFQSGRAGLVGSFRAGVNGAGRVDGTTVPHGGGTAVQIVSQDAGQVMAAAGVFDKGRGGRLDLVLQPAAGGEGYDGSASFGNFFVQDAPALAALLSAVSVVGLLDQLNGQGIHFSDGDVDFRVRPAGVEILNGAAIGPSMGISFEGLWRLDPESIDIQGTISPFYLLNGIGQIFGRRGEGLFGFNYRMYGHPDRPQVAVNPLSILTPGMFREIFRRAPPRLEGQG